MSAEFSTRNERVALASFLDQQRDALLRKIRGVSDEDARRTPTASSLSLLGLLKHSTVWETRWFEVVVAGRPASDGWPERSVPGAEFKVDEHDTVDGWIVRYERAAARSREVVAGMSLDDDCVRTDIIDENLRWVLLHMIEETARHAGHADIIRETLDGSTEI